MPFTVSYYRRGSEFLGLSQNKWKNQVPINFINRARNWLTKFLLFVISELQRLKQFQMQASFSEEYFPTSLAWEMRYCSPMQAAL